MSRFPFAAAASLLALACFVPLTAHGATQVEVDAAYGNAGRSVGRMHLEAVGTHRFAITPTSIRRYLASGVIDTTFGTDGELAYETESDRNGFAVVDPSGRIVVFGRRQLRRYQPDGRTLDATFGAAGVVDFASLPLPTDGFTGTGFATAGGSIVFLLHRSSRSPHVVRLLPDGTLDPDFGTGGSLSLDELWTAHVLTRLPGGRILVGGRSAYGCRTGSCPNLVLVDDRGGRVGPGASTGSAYLGAVTPTPDGGYAWVANRIDEIGPVTWSESVYTVSIGTVGPDGVTTATRESTYSQGATFTAIARLRGGGFIVAGLTTVMRLTADLRPIAITCCDRRRNSRTHWVVPGISATNGSTVQIARADASSFDLVFRSPDWRGSNDQAARLRLRWNPARTLRAPQVTARWPRTRFWFRARLPVSWVVRPGERAIASITADDWGTSIKPPIHPARRRGMVQLPVAPGHHCFQFTVVDVLSDYDDTRLCVVRPDLPTQLVTLRGCVDRSDAAAYLGRSIRCARSGSSVTHLLSEDSEMTAVLRTCSGCGIARVTVTGDDVAGDPIRQVRIIDLDASRRGRRIVRFEQLGNASVGGADRVTIVTSNARSAGVTLEGLDAS